MVNEKAGSRVPWWGWFLLSNISGLLHQTIKKVTEDIEALRFNTAISQMMVFTIEDDEGRAALPGLTRTLRPDPALSAPIWRKKLWEVLGHRPSVSQQPWPIFDPVLTVSGR